MQAGKHNETLVALVWRSLWTANDIVIASTAPLREKWERGWNFVKEEECQLARSVLHVSQDPVVGNG
jgi:hypothetical protein